MEKPSARREEAKWLERPVAAFLLTGGRRSEVLGFEVYDLSFDRKTVTFRPNEWRRLKTSGSHRVVPLWPQLEEILRPYVFGPKLPARPLFPSFTTGREAMLTDFRKLLDAVSVRAGWQPGAIRSKMFRHTYCAARLKALDQGAQSRRSRCRARSATGASRSCSACTATWARCATAPSL
jgi:integrase